MFMFFKRCLFLFIILLLISCNHEEKTNTKSNIDKFTFNQNITFNMIYCPGGNTPIGVDEKGWFGWGFPKHRKGYWDTDDKVKEKWKQIYRKIFNKKIQITPFYLGETEVTINLWNEVYSWAIHNGYVFSSTHINYFNKKNIDSNHPISMISWGDAIVFCNALTDYYNNHNENGNDLNFVYFYGINKEEYKDKVIKNSLHIDYEKTNITLNLEAISSTNKKLLTSSKKRIKKAVTTIDADGFRLPKSYEWECAARYIDGQKWNHGGHVSGDLSGPVSFGLGEKSLCKHKDLSNDYQSYVSKQYNKVKTLTPNALGYYDMSGNLSEWCFDQLVNNYNNRVIRGGSYSSGRMSLRIGYVSSINEGESELVGFRLARTK